VFDASRSTLPISVADFQTRYAATHTNQANRKQSTPGPFKPARAGIARTKVRQTEIGVDTVVPSTHLQSAVTDWPQVRPALSSMAPGPHIQAFKIFRQLWLKWWRHRPQHRQIVLLFRCDHRGCTAIYRLGRRFLRPNFRQAEKSALMKLRGK